MTDSDERIFSFCYDRYKTAEADVSGVYTLVGIMLTVQTALAAGLAVVADSTLARRALVDVVPVLYLGLLLVGFAFWIIAGVHLVRAAIPRSDYPGLTRLQKWLDRLREIRAEGADAAKGPPAEERLFGEIIQRMAEAEDKLRTTNEKRRKRLLNCVRMSIWALALLVGAFVTKFLLS